MVFGAALLASPLAAAAVPEHVPGQPITLYVNRDGGRIVRGTDNPRDGADALGDIAARSDMVVDDLYIPPLPIPDDQWAATMACVRDRVSSFNITVVDENPGDVSHQEVFVGAKPEMFDLIFSTGVAPAALDCSVFVDGIAFVFGNSFWFEPVQENQPWRITQLCETIVHEAGHMWGLDHVLEASDIMSYLYHPEDRRFQDTVATCGRYEDEPENCGALIGACGPTQNSYAMLMERFGPYVEPETVPGEDEDSAPTGDAGEAVKPAQRSSGCQVGAQDTFGGAGVAPGVLMAVLLLGRRRRRA